MRPKLIEMNQEKGIPAKLPAVMEDIHLELESLQEGDICWVGKSDIIISCERSLWIDKATNVSLSQGSFKEIACHILSDGVVLFVPENISLGSPLKHTTDQHCKTRHLPVIRVNQTEKFVRPQDRIKKIFDDLGFDDLGL